MSRMKIVGFGSADGIFNGLGCDPGTVEYNGDCLAACPAGTQAVDRSDGTGYDYRCEGTGTRVTGGGGSSGSGYSSGGPSVSPAGIAIGAALVVAGLLGWFVFSLISPTSD